MRRASVVLLVGASYTMLLGLLLVLVLALTTAFADGWKLRAATAKRVDSAPQLSPDGSLIAFVRAEAAAPRLWVMGDDGSDQRPLAAATEFAWARRHVLLFARAGKLFRISADGGPAIRAPGRLPAPQHDRRVFARGKHIWLRDGLGRAWKLT